MAKARTLILAGDVGGTNTRLALFEPVKGRLAASALEIFPSRAHAGLGEIIAAFLHSHRARVASACFGVAGPVTDGRVAATNLPWKIDARRLGLPKVELLNDLAANALGIAELSPSDFRTLQAGRSIPSAMKAIISPGTGLGEAGLLGETPIPTEGGHADFAPRTPAEIGLLKFLLREHDRVSYERVLSGPGLADIYRYLSRGGELDPALISKGRSALCAKALDLFIAVLGAEAGNLALKFLAQGGLYIGGGIAPKILPRLGGPAFLGSFLAKGRMRPLLEKIPVRVILNDKAALLGAARRAADAA